MVPNLLAENQLAERHFINSGQTTEMDNLLGHCSIDQSFHWPWTFGQMSVVQISVGQICQQNVCWPNVYCTKCPLVIMSVGLNVCWQNVCWFKMFVGKMSIAQMCVRQMSFG
jgi:hypothetical protein